MYLYYLKTPKKMTKQIYKSTGKKTLFDAQFSIEKLSEIGNPLEKINNVIDFGMFRGLLEAKLPNTAKKNNAGAKPFDVVKLRSQTSQKAALFSRSCSRY